MDEGSVWRHHLIKRPLGRGLDLGVGVCQNGRDDGDDGGQAGGQLPGGAEGHGSKHLDAALLGAPGLVLGPLEQRTQQQLDTWSRSDSS